MQIVDFHPLKGTFLPGDAIQFSIEIESSTPENASMYFSVWHLAQIIVEEKFPLSIRMGSYDYHISIEVPKNAPRGYGVQLDLLGKNDQFVCSATTAFDVLNHWAERPRYGFLTDFSPRRRDIHETIDSLARYHINGLQFYDWQYRHDCLLSPVETYDDPLGRKLSLDTVREFIDEAHERGMAVMPYLAVYAASLSFWQQHKDWGLYDADRNPVIFDGFLGLMDPSPYSPWIDHLLNECERALENTSFDGLHVDQYGKPKEGYNFRGDKVDIPSAFNYFIWLLKKRFPEATITFNAVGNWPIDRLANAPQDFLYIEVWPPTTRYSDLLQIIKGGREQSSNKPIVIALYLPADWESNIRLVDSLIFASGGCRIEIGERNRLLADPYFPNHQPITPSCQETLRKYYDFAVRYGDLIGSQAEDVDDVHVEVSGGVQAIVRKVEGRLAISLINFSGIDHQRWDEEHLAPYHLNNFTVQVSPGEYVKDVNWSSPDGNSSALSPVDWRVESGVLIVDVPKLDYWSLLVVDNIIREEIK